MQRVSNVLSANRRMRLDHEPVEAREPISSAARA
jgi:hypothetical protein